MMLGRLHPPGQSAPLSLQGSTSVYLDLLRFLAALTVFVNHAHNFAFPSSPPTFLVSHGRDAVAVFFVLSGFVISHVTASKERNWRQYAAARTARIYSVALLALAVTFLADRFGAAACPTLYADLPQEIHSYAPASLGSLLPAVTFTSQWSFIQTSFGTDEPFWSLSFEVMYYVLFGMLVYAPRRIAIPAAVLWMGLCWGDIATYLPLWLIGAGLYGAMRNRLLTSFPRSVHLAIATAAVLALGVLIKLMSPGSSSMASMIHLQPIGQRLYNFGYYTLLGLLVATNIAGFHGAFGGRNLWPPRLAAAIRWLAGASFTLYLVHQPLLIAASCAVPGISTSSLAGFGTCLAVLASVGVLAELGERKKIIFARIAKRIFRIA